jgi:hypothetical protein
VGVDHLAGGSTRSGRQPDLAPAAERTGWSPLSVFQVQLALGSQAQRRQDVAQFDESVVLSRFVISQMPLIGLLRKKIEPSLGLSIKLDLTKRSDAVSIQASRRAL